MNGITRYRTVDSMHGMIGPVGSNDSEAFPEIGLRVNREYGSRDLKGNAADSGRSSSLD